MYCRVGLIDIILYFCFNHEIVADFCTLTDSSIIHVYQNIQIIALIGQTIL